MIQDPKVPKFTVFGDVLIAAVEGGIGYWAEVKSYHWKSGDVECQIRECDPVGYWHIVTERNIKAAMRKIISGKVETNKYIIGACAAAYATKDAGDIDSEIADVIVQVTVLGAINYA